MNKGLCVFVNALGKLHFPFQNLLKGQVIGCASEGRFPADKLVENAPKSPNVGSASTSKKVSIRRRIRNNVETSGSSHTQWLQLRFARLQD